MIIRELSSSMVWDYENGFYWFSEPNRLNKALAHYELYKLIQGIPGAILEFGVYKSASLIRWATYRQLLENDYSRKIIGFDAFGAFPEVGLSEQSDVEFIDSFTMAGGDGLSLDESQAILEHKGFKNIELVEGNVFDSIPKYLSDRPETRVALLHLDMDVKEPTEFALEMLYDRVVPGGLIVVDDYNAVEGATLAVDRFLSKKHLKLEKLPYYNVPAFIRKPL